MLVIRNTLEYTNALIAALEDMLDVIATNCNEDGLTKEETTSIESACALVELLTRE